MHDNTLSLKQALSNLEDTIGAMPTIPLDAKAIGIIETRRDKSIVEEAARETAHRHLAPFQFRIVGEKA